MISSAPRATSRDSFQQLAERDDVVLRTQALFLGVVQLSEAGRLPPVVDRDDAGASENSGRKLLLAGLVRADGGDMCAGVEPVRFDQWNGRLRRRDDNVGAAHRLLDGIAEPRGQPQAGNFIDEGLRACSRARRDTHALDRSNLPQRFELEPGLASGPDDRRRGGVGT